MPSAFRGPVKTDADDPNVWSGRALQVDFAELAVSGLASMYPVSSGAVLLRTIMDISARAVSLADSPRLGHLGHQCSHALLYLLWHSFS
jgi:hypothetical protein